MEQKKRDGSERSPLLASFVVGCTEATLLHPLVTWIKMSHVRETGKVVFPSSMTAFEKFKLTCRGIHLAAPNKAFGRVANLGVQPIIRQKIGKIDGHFGEEVAQVMAGIGPSIVSTLITMPLDTYKSRRQTGVPTRSIMVLLQDSRHAFAPTIARNLIGMSSLFGGAAFVRQRLPGVADGSRVASASEDLGACLFGGVLGAVLSNPADVIKTCVQVRGQQVGQVIRQLGFFGMGRGLKGNLIKGFQRGMACYGSEKLAELLSR